MFKLIDTMGRTLNHIPLFCNLDYLGRLSPRHCAKDIRCDHTGHRKCIAWLSEISFRWLRDFWFSRPCRKFPIRGDKAVPPGLAIFGPDTDRRDCSNHSFRQNNSRLHAKNNQGSRAEARIILNLQSHSRYWRRRYLWIIMTR